MVKLHWIGVKFSCLSACGFIWPMENEIIKTMLGQWICNDWMSGVQTLQTEVVHKLAPWPSSQFATLEIEGIQVISNSTGPAAKQ